MKKKILLSCFSIILLSACTKQITMAATVQNLQIYTSDQGNEDYYQQFLDKAIETSNLTGGKPVSIFDREDGEVIITAENGEITYSK